MFLAAIHIPPVYSLAVAAMVLGWITWYWIRLGQEHVPTSRRTIRRISLAVMTLTLIPLVRGASFVDRAVEPREYVVTWTVALLLILAVIACAALDAINSLRLHQRMAHDAISDSARELMDAIHRREQDALHRTAPEVRNGEDHPA